jgi:hypothetical protein
VQLMPTVYRVDTSGVQHYNIDLWLCSADKYRCTSGS